MYYYSMAKEHKPRGFSSGQAVQVAHFAATSTNPPGNKLDRLKRFFQRRLGDSPFPPSALEEWQREDLTDPIAGYVILIVEANLALQNSTLSLANRQKELEILRTRMLEGMSNIHKASKTFLEESGYDPGPEMDGLIARGIEKARDLMEDPNNHRLEEVKTIARGLIARGLFGDGSPNPHINNQLGGRA